MSIQTSPEGKAFMTLREASKHAGCSTTTLRRAVRAKELAQHRFGKNETKAKIYIKVTDLTAYLDGCRIASVVG